MVKRYWVIESYKGRKTVSDWAYPKRKAIKVAKDMEGYHPDRYYKIQLYRKKRVI